jgi:hypothetical protein
LRARKKLGEILVEGGLLTRKQLEEALPFQKKSNMKLGQFLVREGASDIHVSPEKESGNLEGLLQDVATHYDTEVEYSMKKMSEAIGPLLTVGLAAVVGFFALAIFLPMWDLTLMAK